MGPLGALAGFAKLLQLPSSFFSEFAECDDINVDGNLLHALCELYKLLFFFFDGTAGEDNDALLLGLVLAMLES